MVDIAVAKKRGRPPKVGSSTTSAPAAAPKLPRKPGRPAKLKRRGPQAKLVAALVSDTLNSSASAQQIKIQGSERPQHKQLMCDRDGEQPKQTAKEQQQAFPPKGRAVGRPRKAQPSVETKEVEVKLRRSLGRPSTGAAKWNIERTGRKIGRPKKKHLQPAVVGDGTPKKRGRPSTVGKTTAPSKPTGKPRGRPKATSTTVKAKDNFSEAVEEEHEDEEIRFCLDDNSDDAAESET